MKIPDSFGLPQQAMTQRRFDRAAVSFDAADAVPAEARERLLERLLLLGDEPSAILDLGAATGSASTALSARYPRARIIAADSSLAMVRRARDKCAGNARIFPVRCDAHALPCADESIDLVFANWLLSWVLPDRVFGECARVLRPGGLALFTTLGPDTLIELRRAWAAVDDKMHVHGFIDMHDIGDLAARAGLVEPVVDVDRVTISYPGLAALLADLRATGAANSAAGRREGLTGRSRWRAFEAAFRDRAGAGRSDVTVELVFAQAWGAGRRRAEPRLADGVARIAAEDLARTAKKARPEGS
jgi:malonyl-CoA O-methyltransferase